MRSRTWLYVFVAVLFALVGPSALAQGHSGELERTLGIRIERMQEASVPQRQARPQVAPRMKPGVKTTTMVALEGEFLQTQMEL